MTSEGDNQVVAYPDFRQAWLDEVTADDPPPTEKGRRFAAKIISQWLDEDDASLDITFCDGAGDGGIDVAILERDTGQGDAGPSGDVWYLVQSKYGAAFAGEATLVTEALKVIDTLTEQRQQLSSISETVRERLTNFRKAASENDRIVLVFATVDPLTDSEKQRLQDVVALGRERVGPLFDVLAISIRTIHDALAEEEKLAAERKLTVPLSGHLANAGNDLLVGSVKLTELYQFLKDFRACTGNNLDQLYEKNVRKFLGGRVKVNRAMQTTLRDAPERFGLYNNGITIVVSDFVATGSGSYNLVEPFVVNGCQTTRTVWEVCNSMLDSGGTAVSPVREAWRERAERGCVVAKIAKVGHDGEALLQDITRYTNSQNAVRDKDFIALDSGFKAWKATTAAKYDLFFEVQRGAWDSQRAFQKQKPGSKQFKKYANGLDLIKVYGSGWLAEPGLAFGKNPPFLPGGSIFQRIIQPVEAVTPFGADDLYAAYLLLQAGETKQFGRGGLTTRRQTKFLFYFVVVNLLRATLQTNDLPSTNKNVTAALVKLLPEQTDGGIVLINSAVHLIDTYMNQEDDSSFSKEVVFSAEFGFDLNAFLKWEQLGRFPEKTPKLQQLLFFQKQFMKQKGPGLPSANGTIVRAL